MKNFVLMLMVLTGCASAQVSPQIQGAGAPTNPCYNGGQQYVDTTNHVLYGCPSSGSNWTNLSIGNTQPTNIRSLASDPSTCSTTDTNGNNNIYYNTASAAYKYCSATNTWSAFGSGGAVSSVFTRTGAVVAASGDYTAAQVTNAVAKNATNVYSSGLQDFTGVTMELPESAGCTTNVDSTVCIDTNTGIEHLWGPGAVDAFNVVTSSTSTTATQVLHATSTAGLYVPGAIAAADLPATLTANPQTSTYQVLASDFTSCKTINVASGNFTITLVASGSQPANGQCIWIVNYGASTVTVARSGQNINGAASNFTLLSGNGQPNSAFIVSDGTNYTAAVMGNAVLLNSSNTGAAAMALNLSALTGANALRIPVQSSCTAGGATGDICYDSTLGKTHVMTNGSDSYVQTKIATQTDTITGADYTNATTTPSTLFSFTLPATTAAASYKYDCSMLWESTAATLVGAVFGVNLSAAPTQLTASAAVQNTLAGADVNGYLSNTTTGSQTLVTSGAAGVTSTNYWAHIWGTIEGAAAAGSTFIINAASTSNTTALLNIRRGGICTLTWQ